MFSTKVVNPGMLAGGAHTIFVSGNDAGAKARVVELLQSFGWQDILDLGDITTARSVEMLVPIWVQLIGVVKKPVFSFKVVR